MKNILTLILVFGCLSFFTANAQEEEPVLKYELPERYKMIGLNTTPLLTQLIPFNRSSTLTGPYMLNYRSFRGDNAFRFGLGALLHQVLSMETEMVLT